MPYLLFLIGVAGLLAANRPVHKPAYIPLGNGRQLKIDARILK